MINAVVRPPGRLAVVNVVLVFSEWSRHFCPAPFSFSG
jgi:hypothetical protein